MNDKTNGGALAVMDRAFGAANEHYADLVSEYAKEGAERGAIERRDRYLKEHREARAAFVHLMAAAESVTTNPDMTTVRGRQEMTRRLEHLRAVLARITP